MSDNDRCPTWNRGVPYCNQDRCPQYDGKRCRELGCRPSLICEPAVMDMASDRAAWAEERARLVAERDVARRAYLTVVDALAPETTGPDHAVQIAYDLRGALATRTAELEVERAKLQAAKQERDEARAERDDLAAIREMAEEHADAAIARGEALRSELRRFARFVTTASKHTSPNCTAATCAKCEAMAILAASPDTTAPSTPARCQGCDDEAVLAYSDVSDAMLCPRCIAQDHATAPSDRGGEVG